MILSVGRLARIAPIAVALVLAACSGTPSPSATANGGGGGGGGGGTTVNATLSEFKVELDKTEIPAGKVTFEVKNTGKLIHEFVVFKTDDAADKLPMQSEAGESKVNEDDSTLTSMGEVEDVPVGGSKSFSADLTPGTYVAVCNLEGHYMSGMHIAFTVQ